jgi:hypothetical protein
MAAHLRAPPMFFSPHLTKFLPTVAFNEADPFATGDKQCGGFTAVFQDRTGRATKPRLEAQRGMSSRPYF